MGTPDFAVPAFEALRDSPHEVVLVITQPDRPKGRGRKLTASPVKKVADASGYPIFQPVSLRNQNVQEKIQSLDPDLLVVIAFGHVLTADILAIPRYGAINVHASILPKYRGPAPIQWAVINGDRETGVTTMMMDSGVDTGDILLTAREPIGPEDTAGHMHDRLARVGAELLITTLEALAGERLTPIVQEHIQATYAPMLTKGDGRINWRKPAVAIESFIRGVSPWPGAFTFYGSKRIKIYKARTRDSRTDKQAGTVLESFPGELWVATGEGVLSILEIQGASGKRLPVEDFLRGTAMIPGEQLQ